MRILGIDPGLRATGYGFLDVKKNKIVLLETGTIEPKQKDLIQNRISKIHKNLDELIRQYRPDVMVLEKLFTHHQHPTTASLLGHIRGVICLLCAQRKIKLVEHSVRRIRHALTSKGAASKQQTQKMVAHILNIDEKKLTPDASDALALALGYAQISSYRL